MNIIYKIVGALLAVPLVSPVVAFAMAYEPPYLPDEQGGGDTTEINWEERFDTIENFSDFVTVFWGYASHIIFTLSILTIITGGVVYVASEGADEKINIAKDIIKGAVISIILVIISGTAIDMLLEKPAEGVDPNQYIDSFKVLNNTSAMLIGLAGGFTIVMLMINGFKYISAAGDEEQIMKARKGMTYSIIGLVVCVSAYVIVRNVISIF